MVLAVHSSSPVLVTRNKIPAESMARENERNELSQNLLHTTSLKEEVNKWKNDFGMINTEYAATKKKQFVLLELLGENFSYSLFFVLRLLNHRY